MASTMSEGIASQQLTKRQHAVLKTLRESKSALTSQDVWTTARVHEPSLGLATVYRALKALVDAHLLHRIVIEGEDQARYRACSREHHHHFVCRACDRVLEIKGCAHGLKDMVPPNYQIEHHTITLYGVCGLCSEATP